MEQTILELADRLQELLMENDMEDVPVVLATENGYTHLSESAFRLETVEDGDGYIAVVIRP